MRPIVRSFAEDIEESLALEGPIVEIGARAAEGQEAEADLRGIFGDLEYIGCDAQEGPGVDRLEDVHHLTFGDATVGTVLTFDTLEHVADPIRAVNEMYRVLRPGGILAMSSVMFFPIHEHPHDYWRFTPQAFELLLEPFESRLVVAHGYPLLPQTIFGLAVKHPGRDLSLGLLPRTARACETWGTDRRVDFGPIRLTVRELWRNTLRYSIAAARTRVTARVRGPNR